MPGFWQTLSGKVIIIDNINSDQVVTESLATVTASEIHYSQSSQQLCMIILIRF